MNELPAHLVYTTEEAAAQLGVGVTKLKSLIKSGELRSIKIGRLRRVFRISVEDYLQRLFLEQNGGDV